MTKGFVSVREVIAEKDGVERKFTVECKILEDSMGKPLFECDLMEHGEDGLYSSHTVKRSKSPQTSMRTALEAVGVVEKTKKRRRWCTPWRISCLPPVLSTALQVPLTLSPHLSRQKKRQSMYDDLKRSLI